MKAYATLLCSETYLPGVLALNQSLRRSGTAYPLVVAVSADFPVAAEAPLRQSGALVRRVSESSAISKEMIEGNGHWGPTFNKIHLFGLVEFSKLVYVDSDMMVLSNIDELFDRPHMSSVPAGRLVHPDWNRLNSGIMVIEPQEQLADRIFAKLPQALAEVAAMGAEASGDQDLLNAYYPAWPNMPELELDQGYNVFQCYLDIHIEKHGYRLPDDKSGTGLPVKIVHFVGPYKPWMKGAAIRHYLRRLRRGKSVKWEAQLFTAYKKLLKDSAVPAH
jgi:glycogenin